MTKVSPKYAPVVPTIAVVLAASVAAAITLTLVLDCIPPGGRSLVHGFVLGGVAIVAIVLCNLLYHRRLAVKGQP
jgi:hypothetical protein